MEAGLEQRSLQEVMQRGEAHYPRTNGGHRKPIASKCGAEPTAPHGKTPRQGRPRPKDLRGNDSEVLLAEGHVEDGCIIGDAGGKQQCEDAVDGRLAGGEPCWVRPAGEVHNATLKPSRRARCNATLEPGGTIAKLV